MSLIEDAREIDRNELRTLTVTGQMVCVFCGRNPCRSNCVRHSLPQIVAALEAAERVVDVLSERRPRWIAMTDEDAREIEAIAALVAALKGEGETA